ncbi:hypothetical protein Taro_038541 [Colocasia esculenta]|uniref:Uncharacterized protein n=1 Tax=Colocasia esculenta TaxID=4460 RepID=A0A843WMH5_COLES|nr:hypothetical protein [Colocasia esculenta]
MDPHPTPYPGKLRPSANSKKDKGEGKTSKEPSRLATVASRHRHGSQSAPFILASSFCLSDLSTNVTVEKPPQEQTKAFKLSKPSVTSKKLPSKSGAKVELKKETAGSYREDVEDAARKPKSEPRKTSVRFQDHPPEEKGSGEGVAEDGPRTPMSSVKPTVLLGTPFYSAKSCSKCRFDRLESAPYWLNQIKLAESVGKHFVSVAFFRLALECNAEPIRSLKSEIKRYMARHSSLHVVTVWKEVCRDYGLLNEDLSVGVIVLDPVAASAGEKETLSVVQQGVSGDRKDGCLGSGFGGIPESDSSGNSTKDADSTSVELNGNTGENPSAAVIGEGTQVLCYEDLSKPAVRFSEDNLMTVENPSADSTSVELNSNTGENPSPDSTSVELNSNTGENPSADSIPVKLDSSTGENPSDDSTPVKLNSNTGENPSADSTPVELNSNSGENPSADSTSVGLNSNTRGNLSAALIGVEAKEVVNKPTVSFPDDSLMVERTDGSSVVNECGNEGSSVVGAPGEHFLLQKYDRSTSLSPKDSSSMRKQVQPHNLADTSDKTSSVSQAASGSCGERVDKSKDEPKRNQKSKEAAKKNQKGRVKSPRWM